MHLSSDELYFGSVCWVAEAMILIPKDGKFLVGTGYGVGRKLLDVVTPEDLSEYLQNRWEERIKVYHENKAREAAQQAAIEAASPKPIDLEGLSIEDFEL